MAVFVDKLLIALGIDPRGAEQGLDRVNNSVDRTDAKLDELKHKAGDVARSIAMQIAGPLLAAFSVGKMVQGYISDVAEVAEQTGAYNKKLEEERLKKAQLQRVTKEDVELYKRGREAFVKFQIAMSDFSAKLMRTLMPFVKDLLDKLNRFTDWISHNSNNIIRFLTILASTITLALIPAVAKFTAALLKNPLAWVAGLVLALALAIDDLVVYLKGGRSEFDAFWKWLGFTKGDTETLTKAVNWLKTSGVELLKTIGKLTAAFVGMRAVWGVISMVRKAWNALSLSVLANPVVLAIGLLVTAAWMLYKNWDDVCEGAKALWEDLTSLFMSWCRSMADGIEALGESVASFFTSWGRGIADGFAALADDIGSALSGIWQGVKDGASALAEDGGSALAGAWQGMKEGAAAVGETVGNAFTAAGRFIARTWEGVKEGAAAVCASVGGFFSGMWRGISNGAADAGDAISRWLSAAGNTVKRGWQNISEGAAAVGATIADAFATAVSAISDSMAWAGEKIDEGLTAIGDFASDTWQGIKDGASALAEDAGSAFGAMGAAVAPALGWIADKASGVWQSVSDGAVSAGNAMLSAFDSAKSGIGGVWQDIKDGASALVDGIENAFSGLTEWFSSLWDRVAGAFTSALDAVSGVWQGMKDGASALVDDIENVFSGLTGWFSSLWDKITGIFDRAIGGIKSGIMSVTDALGITDSKRDEQAAPTPADPEFERQKQAIIARRKKREQAQAVQTDNVPVVRTEKAAAGKPESREPAQPVRTGVSAPAVKTEKITEKRTEVRERIVPLVLRAHQAGQQVQQILAGAGRAQGVKTPAVNSGAVSNVRNSTQKSTINNDNRRQEVNITVNGNADTKTVGQIKDGVTGVFAQGAASPVMG